VSVFARRGRLAFDRRPALRSAPVKQRRTPSSDEIRQLSEHLNYEVEMTFGLIALLLDSTFWEPRWRAAHNAQVESFTIHVRQLIDFFWKDDPRKDDATAADYFAPGEWHRLRPKRSRVIDEAMHRKIGSGVAHLTYGRAQSTVEDKQWPFVEIGQALVPAVFCFLDNVDRSKLEPEHYNLMRDSVESFHKWIRHRKG
jgi:hypothetical protein